MADNKITIEVGVSGNADAQFKVLTKGVQDFGKETQKSLLDVNRAFDVFAGTLASQAFVGAFNLLTDAAGKLFGVLEAGVQAAIEQEDALNQLNQALRASGQFTPQASEELQAFATQLQNTTKFADETVLSAAALIQNIARLDKEGLQRATAAAADLSAALGIDLQSAAQLVAKAAEGQTGALKRYGITVHEGANNTETFNNVLTKLNQQFGGAAAAQVNTYSGATTQLNNQYGELLETIGQIVIENPALVAVIKEAAKIFGELNSTLGANKGALSAFVTDGIVFMLDGVKLAVPALQTMSIGAIKVAQAFVGAQGVLSAFSDTVTFGLTDAGKRAQASADKFVELDQKIRALENSTTFAALSEGVERLRQAATNAAAESSTNADRQIESMTRVREKEIEIDLEKLQKEEDDKVRREEETRASYEKAIADLQAQNDALAEIDRQANADKIARNQQAIDELAANEAVSAQTRLNVERRRVQEEKRIEQERVAAGKQALNDLSVFTTAKSAELQAIGKTAAIASTTISTYEGATKAYSALAGIPIVGPALGAAAAAAAIAAGLARVAAIRGTPLATGLTSVPAGFNNDTFPARLSSGERVVSAPQNQDLTRFLEDSAGTSAKLDVLIDLFASRQNQTVVNIGGRELVNVMQDEIDSGRSLAV